MRKLTKKWLIKNDACADGIKWFNRAYPTGLILTKKNVTEAIEKLLKGKKRTRIDVCGYLNWLIRQIDDDMHMTTLETFYWAAIEKKEIIEAFWEDLLNIGKLKQYD